MRKAIGSLCVILAGVTAAGMPAAANDQAKGIRPERLRCEWLVNPEGIGTREPRLSWIVTADDADRGQKQTAFHLVAARERALLEPGQADLWDSGRVRSGQTIGVVYESKPLASGMKVFWKVKVWDRDGVASAWSEPAFFTVGLLDASDWKGQWISGPDGAPLHANPKQLFLPPARQYRKPFTTTKLVKRAVLHGTALGLVDWSLDGKRVTDDLFEPGWADYQRRVHARSHDVTEHLATPGPHCLGATVADGWYAGYVGYGMLVGYGPHKTGRNIYGKTPAILCQLDIEYADGSRESVVTDPSWQVTSAGPVREADLLMGEHYDARQEIVGWDTPALVVDQKTWEPAVPAESNPSVAAPFFESGVKRDVQVGWVKPETIVAYAAQPIRVTEELPAKRVVEQKPGVFIFDMGQNFAGVVRLKVTASSGTKIVLRHGEMLHPDGRLMTENLRKARATDTYVCKGGGEETWAPRFTYHGFQFVEVSGLPAGALPPLDTITGLVLHTDTPLVGRFACSDELLTQFWKNTVWTQRANFIEVPTDCPQRDERLGWMGDAQIYARTATFNADVAAFFSKWMDDVREAQRTDGPDAGAYPDYCPYPFGHGKPKATFGTAWTDAGVICPFTMYSVYGDRRMIERHWDSMTAFMDWRLRMDPKLEGVEVGNTWGDWLNVNETTPIRYIDLCYHAQSAWMMYQLGQELDKLDEGMKFLDRYLILDDSFRRQYLRDNGTLKIETQTACALALECGLIPDDSRATVAKQLASLIEKNGFRMATGFLGTKSILPALSNNGHHDLACRLFQSRAFPSWGYEVEQGANSVWERWDSFTHEHGFNGATGKNNAAMNSFSHYAFGAAMEWGFRDLAGIKNDKGGCVSFAICPRPPTPGSNPERAAIEWVEADYDSPQGLIQSHWRRIDGDIEMRLKIPANTSALVHVPTSNPASVREGEVNPQLVATGHIQGITLDAIKPDKVVLEVGSGTYRFLAR